jgi:hypothetical protein
MELFDEIHVLQESDIDEGFNNKYKDKLKPNLRGFGYWAWKPEAIKQVLSQIDDGDLLLYLDVGCNLNHAGKKRLGEYFEIVERAASGVLGFQAVPPELPLVYDGRSLLDLRERIWTKGDVLDYFSVRDNPQIVETPQFGSGVIFFRKCQESKRIIDEWLGAIDWSFSMLDDTPSVSANLEGFVEHRHDQSIFSILCKLHNVDRVSAYEYWYPSYGGRGADWEALEFMPIHAKRSLDFGPAKNLRRVLKNKVHGLKKRILGE